MGEDRFEVVKENSPCAWARSRGSLCRCRAWSYPRSSSRPRGRSSSVSRRLRKSRTRRSREIEVREPKYAADLVQLPAEKKISPNPKDWVCEESGMRENLWLNLSDGHIGVDASTTAQVARTGAQPLQCDAGDAPADRLPAVVKLGTITPHGADVYSYAPDGDTKVKDPKLAEHLAIGAAT